MEILEEIRTRTEADTRSIPELMTHLRAVGWNMFISNTISHEATVSFCSALIRVFLLTREKYTK